MQSAPKRKHSKEEADDGNSTEVPAKKSKIEKAKGKSMKKKNKKIVESKKSKSNDQQINSENENDPDTDSSKTLENINVNLWVSMGVPTVVIKALADQNFHSPTAIQAQTLPAAILGRRDILGAAETGSGKTLAFGIPIIKGILDLKSQHETTVPKESVTDNIQKDKVEAEGK